MRQSRCNCIDVAIALAGASTARVVFSFLFFFFNRVVTHCPPAPQVLGEPLPGFLPGGSRTSAEQMAKSAGQLLPATRLLMVDL